jgi:hypothetical protein
MSTKTSRQEAFGGGWLISMTGVAVLGLALVLWNPPIPLERLSRKVWPDAWGTLIGIWLISIPLSHLVITSLNSSVRRWLEVPDLGKRANYRAPALVGVCESILYPAAFLTSNQDFIGLWIGLKVALQWTRWTAPPSNSRADPEQQDLPRRRFYAFLIGNALSVMFAGLTFVAFKILAM